MIPKPLRQFISDLQEATDSGEVKWAEGAAQDAYYCAHKAYNLHMSYYFDTDEGVSTYYFRITSKGHEASFSVDNLEGDFRIMNSLWSSIQVNASGFNNIIKDFFE